MADVSDMDRSAANDDADERTAYAEEQESVNMEKEASTSIELDGNADGQTSSMHPREEHEPSTSTDHLDTSDAQQLSGTQASTDNNAETKLEEQPTISLQQHKSSHSPDAREDAANDKDSDRHETADAHSDTREEQSHNAPHTTQPEHSETQHADNNEGRTTFSATPPPNAATKAEETQEVANASSTQNLQKHVSAEELSEMPLTFVAGRTGSAPGLLSPSSSSPLPHKPSSMSLPPIHEDQAASHESTDDAQSHPQPQSQTEPASPSLTFHFGMTPPSDPEAEQGPQPSQPNIPTTSQSLPATPREPGLHRRPSAAELRPDNCLSDRNEAQDVIVSRRGTVVGKRGSISEMRRRFAERSATISTSSPALRHERESAQSSSSSQPVQIPGNTKGVVGRFRQLFMKKASEVKSKPLATILQEKEEAEAEKAGGKIVVYTTSVSTVKETYWNCQKLLKIFHGLMVQYEERDVTLSREFQREMSERLPGAKVPQVFFNGQHLGGIDEVYRLNENNKLQELFRKVPRRNVKEEYHCQVCADRRFVLCTWCGGDKKSMMSRFGKELVKLKCTACNEHGLMKCPACVYGVGTDSSA
eukprot:m.55550 g.55550  ORF g.55550 m.55550 type:complete len:590 (+) comp12952_c0_seq1:39-1808(+)